MAGDTGQVAMGWSGTDVREPTQLWGAVGDLFAAGDGVRGDQGPPVNAALYQPAISEECDARSDED